MNERFDLAHLNLGAIFLSRRHNVDARREFERPAERELDDGQWSPTWQPWRGKWATMPGAIASARRALQIDGSLSNCRRLLFVALDKAGRLDEAIDDCRRLLGANPNDAESRSLLERLLASKPPGVTR